MNLNIIIIYIILFIYFIILLIQIFKKDNTPKNEYLSMIHLSTESSRILDTIRDASIYLNIKPTFVSLNQVDTTLQNKTIHINSTTTINKTNFVTNKKSLSNYKDGYVGGYQELSYLTNYLAANSHNYILYDDYIFSGIHGDTILGIKLFDFINNDILYVFNFTQTWGGYFADNSYRSCYAGFNKIKNIVKQNKFIIVGDFNVQGWEEVAKYVFSDSVYISGDLRFPTCNDNEGLASPDGLIVSKNFCTRIVIDIQIMPYTFNRQHYLIYSKFYNDGPPGMYLTDKSRTFLNYFIKNVKDRPNFFTNYSSKWNRKLHITENQNNYWKEELIENNQKPMFSLENLFDEHKLHY
ncbi:hypothetical protein [Alphaentomopoxvirus acuprea]|uniref:Endonuclease/exonuclease/phosphatase domain-containing protein n=1 Tax=Alphaentomopoxvirus acuprea TaxID=62099 RepID=W6JPL4_9POXV|nr:hypothetical protein BA82_gp124 [Anomala cuprea entomopoxvirus]BAO49484.1 hypothetical protein [Anomala cuprea entomopoxvirus]